MIQRVTIYTDGACRGNPGPGGWGAVLKYGKRSKELYGGEANTTNNRMELTAAIEALLALKRSCHVTLHTDSQYLLKGITEWVSLWKRRRWRTADGKQVKNAELWQRLEQQVTRHQVKWVWVKGHSGNVGNERADALANLALQQEQT